MRLHFKLFLKEKQVYEYDEAPCFGACSNRFYDSLWFRLRTSTTDLMPKTEQEVKFFEHLASTWIDHFRNKHPYKHKDFRFECLGKDIMDTYFDKGIQCYFHGIEIRHAMQSMMFLRYVQDMYRYVRTHLQDEESMEPENWPIEKILVLAHTHSGVLMDVEGGHWYQTTEYGEDSCPWHKAALINVELGRLPFTMDFKRLGDARIAGVNEKMDYHGVDNIRIYTPVTPADIGPFGKKDGWRRVPLVNNFSEKYELLMALANEQLRTDMTTFDPHKLASNYGMSYFGTYNQTKKENKVLRDARGRFMAYDYHW